VQHSPTVAALYTSFLLKHAPQTPQAERIDYKIWGVIQQREYELWVKKIEEIKQQLVEFWQCTNKASEKCNFRILPASAEAQVVWGGIVKRLLIAQFIGSIYAKKYQNPSRVSKL